MGRGAVAAAVVGAVLAGSATGFGLHVLVPGPFADAVGSVSTPPVPSTPGTVATATAGDSSASSTGTPASPTTPATSSSPTTPSSPTTSSTRSPSASDSSSPTSSTTGLDDPDPGFDRSALLRTTVFTTHGWAEARVTNSYPALPQPPITPCAAITAGRPGLVRGNAGAWSSTHTTAQETVGLFADASSAGTEFSRLLDQVNDCTDSSVAISGFARTATASRVDSIRWWNTQGPDAARGIVGVIRTRNRVAVVAISSPDSDPDDTRAHGTTDVDGLLGIAGQRMGAV